MSEVVAQLRTTNLDESIQFYTSKLGFELEFKYEDFYAGIRAGAQLFHLKLIDEKDPSINFVADGDHFHLYFTIDDVDRKAEQLEQNGVTFLKNLSVTPWGTKEFSVTDNQGHILYFGQVQ